MNVLKNLGLGAAMVTTGAMLLGTPVTPKLNTTPSHINFYTGLDYSKEPEYYEKSRVRNVDDLNCSKAVKRYAETCLSYDYCKVYDYTKKQRYLGYTAVPIDGQPTTKSILLVTDDLAHPTFKTIVYDYDMSESEFKKNNPEFTKRGNFYFYEGSSYQGVHVDLYFYPEERYFVKHTSYPDGSVLPDVFSNLTDIIIKATYNN